VIDYEQDELDMAEDAIDEGNFKKASKHLDRFMMIAFDCFDCCVPARQKEEQ
jgi:hypothetical protein